MRRVVLAPDSFKGSIGAAAAARALAAGWRSRSPADDLRHLPLADGGEGTCAVLLHTVPGARRSPAVHVRGPAWQRVEAGFVELPDGTAVVELACAAGLHLGRTAPERATTHGVGMLVAVALRRGATRLVLAVGGSATTDGGSGAAQALGVVLRDGAGRVLSPRGALADLRSVDLAGMPPAPPGGMTILTDVTNPLCGPQGAAAVYGPQKGLGPAQIRTLDAALHRWAELLGVDPATPGLGAAGGTPAPFVAAWGARIASGLDHVAHTTGLDDEIAGADLVITGEGRFDATSLSGKVCGEVARRAAAHGVPLAVVAGSVDEDAGGLLPAAQLVALADLAGSVNAAYRSPSTYLRMAGATLAGQPGRPAPLRTRRPPG